MLRIWINTVATRGPDRLTMGDHQQACLIGGKFFNYTSTVNY